LVVAPVLWIGVALLSMFWLVAEIQYLSVVRSHWAGPGTNFDIDRLQPLRLSDMLSLGPIRNQDLGSLYSLSPAVLLPAVFGAIVAVRDARARMFLGIAIASIVLMVFRDLYRPFFVIPGFAEFGVQVHRPFQLMASFSAPALAAIGLFEAPPHGIDFAAKRWRSLASLRSIALPTVAVAVMALFVADIIVFAARVEGGSRLAYGPSLATPGWAPDLRDIWQQSSSAPLAQQLFDPRQWRAPGVGCDLECPGRHQFLAKLGTTFPSPPARAEMNSNGAQLDMAFHTLVGGGITHSYNDQVIPSRELASWLEQSMLVDSGSTTKTQLATALGVDAVVLSRTQAARAADYLQMGWVQVSSDPVAFINPQPSGLAAQWPSGTAVLVVGRTQASVPALYNFVFERATTGLLPFSTAWLVRSASPYIDDYSDADLGHYSGVMLLGYKYRDQATAWSRLDRYVRGGGHLFIETGWQYVDPDWDVGLSPAILPVASGRWSALDPSAPVQVEGEPDSRFGRFVYGSGGWGASSATSARQGATELVRVGNRVVVARWQVGAGRVLWSGMNIMAHAAKSASADEDRFLAEQLAWLFRPSSDSTDKTPIAPVWNGGDQVTLALQASAGPSLVMLKESFFPGWTARLVTPTGPIDVDLVGTEMDFMLARLQSVPPGSSLVFTYRPTAFEEASWGLSLLTLAGLIVWVVRPALLRRVGGRIVTPIREFLGAVFAALSRRASRWGADP
jgi:hypothetical protein